MRPNLSLLGVIGRPEIVYHYTSLAAMMKILKTQKIWASDIGYLNDSSERLHLLNIVDAELGTFTHNRGIDPILPFVQDWTMG
jgi:hypothetical protein